MKEISTFRELLLMLRCQLRQVFFFEFQDLTLKYYRNYNKYAEKANHYEGCPEIPVDDQIKLLKSYIP